MARAARTRPAPQIDNPGDMTGENDRMLAAIESERGAPKEPWWYQSPWAARKPESYWQLTRIQTFKRDYDATKNPIFVWAAWQVATDLPAPQCEEEAETFRTSQLWIDDYFQATAARLMAAVADPPPSKGTNTCIAKSLAFPSRGAGRGHSPFASAKKLLRDRELALKVWQRIPTVRGKETLAVNNIADEVGCKPGLVGKAWRDFKRLMKQRVQ